MTLCIKELREAARQLDAMPVVADARVVAGPDDRTVEVTLSGRTTVPHALNDAAIAWGLRLDVARSGSRGDDATVVYQ